MDEKETKKGNFLLYGALKSLLWALIITGLSLLLISVIYLSKDLSDELCRNLVTASAIVSVFLSTVVSARKLRSKGLVLGLMTGLGYALCLYLTGFLAFGFPGFGKGLLSTLALCIMSGSLGGIVGVNIKGREK